MTDQMVLLIGMAGIAIFCLLSFFRYGSLIGNANENKRNYEMALTRIESSRSEFQQRIQQGQPELEQLLAEMLALRQLRDRLYIRLLELQELRDKEDDTASLSATKVER